MKTHAKSYCEFSSKEEFRKWIGPNIRNKIQSVTKSAKKRLGSICQECKEKKELEAAHINGKSRIDIINKVLDTKYISADGLICGDLNEIVNDIIQAHLPIEKYFRFLCKGCHREYDGKK